MKLLPILSLFLLPLLAGAQMNGLFLSGTVTSGRFTQGKNLPDTLMTDTVQARIIIIEGADDCEGCGLVLHSGYEVFENRAYRTLLIDDSGRTSQMVLYLQPPQHRLYLDRFEKPIADDRVWNARLKRECVLQPMRGL